MIFVCLSVLMQMANFGSTANFIFGISFIWMIKWAQNSAIKIDLWKWTTTPSPIKVLYILITGLLAIQNCGKNSDYDEYENERNSSWVHKKYNNNVIYLANICFDLHFMYVQRSFCEHSIYVPVHKKKLRGEWKLCEKKSNEI